MKKWKITPFMIRRKIEIKSQRCGGTLSYSLNSFELFRESYLKFNKKGTEDEAIMNIQYELKNQ